MKQDIDNLRVKAKKMQSIILEILCDIDDFCKKNNILWFLSGGTCLGAVRHQGFIPWDDDADIMLPRPEYERFLKLFKKEFKDKYGVGSYETDDTWKSPLAKIWSLKTTARISVFDEQEMGVFVDVFAIDGLPENQLQRSIYYKQLETLFHLRDASVRTNYLKTERFVAIKKVAKVLVKPIGARYFSRKIIDIAKAYDVYTSRFVGVSTVCHYGERETIEREEMSSEARLPFEGHLFPVPKGYDKYLSNLYGDYMTIPKDAEENGYTHLNHWTVEFLDEE